jgi:hypothetical protein
MVVDGARTGRPPSAGNEDPGIERDRRKRMAITSGVAEEFVAGMLDRDFKRMGAVLAPDVYRDGFEGEATDSVRGPDDYLKWLEKAIGGLAEYRWNIHRFEYGASGRWALVEATSIYRVTDDDEPFGYRMVMVLDITEDNKVSKVNLYWKTPGKRLPIDTISRG